MVSVTIDLKMVGETVATFLTEAEAASWIIWRASRLITENNEQIDSLRVYRSRFPQPHLDRQIADLQKENTRLHRRIADAVRGKTC